LDVDVWNADTPPHLEAKLWPFILQAILWRFGILEMGKFSGMNSRLLAPLFLRYVMTL
jgi:hypothetical protein